MVDSAISIAIILAFMAGVYLLFKCADRIIVKANEKERIRQQEREARRCAIEEGSQKLTPSEFFALRSSYRGHLQDFDFMGCYITHNLRNGKYYIGQATHVPQRVNAHFTGKGNGDVYADYRYGHPFEIQLIDITTTTYRRLDDMERELIDMFDACSVGYNKTKGNK